MKFYRYILVAVVAVIFVVFAVVKLTGGSSLRIEGQIIGFDSQMIYLEKSVGGERQVIDSVQLSDIGEFKLSIKDGESFPMLYELRSGWERIPILAMQGETIKINSIGRFSQNYIVEGSRESELLREFYQPYIRRSDELKRIASRYAEADLKGQSTEKIVEEYNKLYNEIKREQLKFIVTNKGNLASIYAIFQRLPGDTHLFNEASDVIYMRTVADSLAVSYETSIYRDVLLKAIADAELRAQLVNSIEYRNYPEIVMNDMYGNPVALSSFEGSVILVDFWSAESGSSNPNNAELKEIYKKHHSDGFEIYQVGVDTSKIAWVSSIQKQRLPWISVSDLKGAGSPTVGIYNVTQLPSNILISKEGEIIGRDIFGDELSAAIDREMKK
ncbi:MAG: thioredoxin-like domain-containing protein [Rikenellaceae bacterium]